MTNTKTGTSALHRTPPVQLRSFGLLMGGVFLLVALWPWLLRGETVRVWAGTFAAIFGLLGVVWPSCLNPIYRSWMKIGEKLGWINSRIILGIIYYGIFTPAAFVLTLLKKKPLHLDFEPAAKTYRVLKQARDANHVLKPF